MPKSPARRLRSPRKGGRAERWESDEPPPMVEVELDGVSGDDRVAETLRSHGVAFRLLACRPADKGRRRLLRLFEIQADGEGSASAIHRLRAELPGRDLAVAHLGPDRAILRVTGPMPALCAAAFDLGDFCIRCPFLGGEDGAGSVSWKLLVPRIGDARRLLEAAAPAGGTRPTLVRAGAYRRRWGLTSRQERALRVAYQIGYFDYPRRATLSALAARLGVGRSTALELLRKATTKLAAQRFLAEPPVDHLS